MNYAAVFEAIETARKIGPIDDPELREIVVKILMDDDGSERVIDDTLLQKARAVVDAVSKSSSGAPRQRQASKRTSDRETVSASDAVRQLFGNRAADDGADSPATQIVKAHFSKQAKELSGELRKRIALDAIDKSDKRIIKAAPANALAAAMIEQRYAIPMNPYLVVDPNPQREVPGEPRTGADALRPADPLMTPTQFAANTYLQTRKPTLIAVRPV